MDFSHYDRQNRPPLAHQQAPQGLESPTSTPHSHSLHQQQASAPSFSFQQHLQLQPVLQPHYQQPHHPAQLISHLPQDHQEASPFVPGRSGLNFTPMVSDRGAGQNVGPISLQGRPRGQRHDFDSILGSVVQGIDPAASRQPPTPVSAQESLATISQHSSPTILAPSLQMLSPTNSQQEALTRQPVAIKQLPASESEAPPENNVVVDPSLGLLRKKTFIHVLLPEGLKYSFADEEGKTITGVMASRVVEKGEMFGPYNGSLLDEEAGKEIGSTWELCMRGNVWFYLDGRNKIHNNWLYHVKLASTREELNLEAFQSYGDIYFRALDTIQPGAELRVFYGKEYRQKIGCDIRLEDLNYNRETNKFHCMECQKTYHTSKGVLRHMKFSHKEEQSSNFSKPKTSNLQDRLTKKARIMEALKNPEQTKDAVENDATAKDSVDIKNIKKDDQFACVTCGKVFQSKGRLIAHELFHEVTCETYKCDVCGLVCNTANSLKQHKGFHTERKFKCPLCFKQYDVRYNFSKHLSGAHGVQMIQGGRMKCTGCSTIFRRGENVMPHLHECRLHQKQMKKLAKALREESEEEEMDALGEGGGWSMYESDELRTGKLKDQGEMGGTTNAVPNPSQPGAEASVLGDGDPNLQKEHGVIDMLGKRLDQDLTRPYKCRFCPQRFRKKDGALRHEMDRHRRRPLIRCEHCPKTFNDRPKFLIHMRKHSKDRRYKCQLCPRSFSSESALRNHQPEHTEERPHKCEPCSKGFKTRKHLMAHIRRIHSVRELKYPCSFCEKKFAEKSSLTLHERRHKGIRPHVCLTCGKAFTSKHCLISHQYIHTGEKPFKCPRCGKGFPLNHHLDSHLLSHALQDAKQ